jgi:hypothetical protein
MPFSDWRLKPQTLNSFRILIVAAAILAIIMLFFDPAISLALFIVVLLCILLDVAILYPSIGGRERRSFAVQKWVKGISAGVSPLRIEPSFKTLDGEKQVFPLTPCYLEVRTPVTWKYYPRDVIITNKRILIGFLTNFLISRKESFGQFNLWGPDAEKNLLMEAPSTLLGGNSRIGKISAGTSEGEDYLEINIDYAMPTSIKLFHPKSKDIAKLFNKK